MSEKTCAKGIHRLYELGVGDRWQGKSGPVGRTGQPVTSEEVQTVRYVPEPLTDEQIFGVLSVSETPIPYNNRPSNVRPVVDNREVVRTYSPDGRYFKGSQVRKIE